MQELIKRGRTSNIFHVFLADIGSLVGGGKTGLTTTSTGLIIAVRRELSAAATVYAAGSSNIETISTLGTFAAPSSGKCRFKEVDATNLPGIYEIHFLDAVLDAADGSRFLTGLVQASGVAHTPFRIPLVAVDLQDAVRQGLTTLLNLAGTTAAVATDGSNSATSFKTTLTESTNDYWKDAWLVITSGALIGQLKRVTAYNGTTKFITVSGGFTGTPADAVTFGLINR